MLVVEGLQAPSRSDLLTWRVDPPLLLSAGRPTGVELPQGSGSVLGFLETLGAAWTGT